MSDQKSPNVFDNPTFREEYLTNSQTDPTLAQRFWLNMTAGRFRETPEGAAGLALSPDQLDSTGALDVEASRAREKLQLYDSMSSSDGLLEYSVAALGDIAGQAMAPSSYISAPVKWASAVLKGIAKPVVGRIADAAIGNAIVSTALDPAVQVANIASGQQSEYDVTQTALAPVAGAVFGGALHAGGEVAARIVSGGEKVPLDTNPKPYEPPVTPDPQAAPNQAAAPDLAEATADPSAALPPSEVRPDSQQTPVATDVPAAVERDQVDATAAIEVTPEATAALTDAQKANEGVPPPQVDRERWPNDGDEIADYARATAEGIEGSGKLPDLLNAEAVKAGVDPVKHEAPPDGLDFITGSEKALATRTAMRGEVAPASGLRAAAGAIEPIKSRRATLKDLVNTLDATVRQGVSGKGTASALGVFNRKTGAVRARNLDDAGVVAHELGHDLHMRVIGKPLDALVNKHKSELKFLDYDPLQMRPHEGFAEWMRIWAVNPRHAEKAAPRFTKEVFDLLDKDQPKIAAALRAYQRDMTAYLAAPSAARAVADMAEYAKPKALAKALDSVKTKGLSQTIGGYFNAAYRSLIDGQTFLRLGTRELLRVAQDNHFKETGDKITFDLKAVDDPYKLKRLASDIKSVGMMDLMHGVRPYGDTRPSTRPLSEGIAVATGQPSLLGKWDDARVKDFGAYLIALRGKWLYEERFNTGILDRPPTAATLGDHIATIKDMEARYPGFKQGAALTHQWARAMLKKRFDGGLLTPEQFAEALKEPFYVPYQRDMTNLKGEDLGGAGKPGTGRDLARSDVKRLKGSDRPIVNPIQSLIQQAFNVNMALRQNDVVRALDRLATRAGPGGAAIAERIPNSKLAAMRVDPLEALRSAGKKQGLSDVDIADLVDAAQDALGEDAFGSLFGSKDIAANGKPIVFFWDGGKRNALQLADGDFGREMYQAIMGLPPMQGDILTRLLSAPNNVFRLSITTNPAFLVANFIRDQMSAWILTDGYIPVWHGGVGMANEVGQGDWAKLYNTSGGISGGALTAETAKAKMDSEINALARKGWVIQRGKSITGWLSIAEVSETGTRVAVFKNAFKAAKKQGLSDYEAVLEGSFIARDYIDFGRRGSNMVAGARIIPFLNAQIQGVDKGIRTLLAPVARHLRGDVLTKQEEKELGSSFKAWAKMSTVAVAGMGLAAINSASEEWQDAPSQLRATSWLVRIPGNGWLAVPKPFELALLANIGERAVEWMQTNDPNMLEKVRDDTYATLLPPDIMDNPIIKTASTLTTGVDSFTKQPVVPDYLRGFEPWLQYQAGTSFMARDLGEVTGQSPLYIDQILNGFFASWGRDVSSLYDAATGRRTSQGWDDMVFTRRFIKDLQRGNTASRVFWDQISQSTGRLAAIKNTYESYATGEASGDAVAYLAKQPPEARAYVALAQSNFDADERRMHPLVRAQNEIGVISLLRREMSDDRQQSVSDKQRIPMSPDQRRMADDVLTKISYGEARNALVVANDPAYAGRPLIDLTGDYDTLAAISPELSDEFNARLANAKVYKFSAVAENWPAAQDRLLEDGTQARLGDLKGKVRSQGYEGDGRRRMPRKEKITVPGADEIAAAQR